MTYGQMDELTDHTSSSTQLFEAELSALLQTDHTKLIIFSFQRQLKTKQTMKMCSLYSAILIENFFKTQGIICFWAPYIIFAILFFCLSWTEWLLNMKLTVILTTMIVHVPNTVNQQMMIREDITFAVHLGIKYAPLASCKYVFKCR